MQSAFKLLNFASVIKFMRIKKFLGLIISVLLVIGCKTTFHLTPEQQQILLTHRTVSILPPKIIFDDMDTSNEKENDYEKKEAYFFQNQFQNILERKMNKYTVIFQDISKTNILLDNEGIGFNDLYNKDKAELGKIFGTDAIIMDTIHKYKPVMTYVPPTNMYYSGYYVYRTTVEINAGIYNSIDGKLLWHGTRYISENSNTYTIEQMGMELIDDVCNQLPYKRK